MSAIPHHPVARLQYINSEYHFQDKKPKNKHNNIAFNYTKYCSEIRPVAFLFFCKNKTNSLKRLADLTNK